MRCSNCEEDTMHVHYNRAGRYKYVLCTKCGYTRQGVDDEDLKRRVHDDSILMRARRAVRR